MLQIAGQTKEEKMAMYMKLPKKQIAEMLINCNDIIKALTQAKNCVIPAVTNRYFHELEQREVDALIADKKTIGYIMGTYKQPDWCKYPNALEGQMGCWSLMDLSKDGLRTKISKDFCKGCDEYSL